MGGRKGSAWRALPHGSAERRSTLAAFVAIVGSPAASSVAREVLGSAPELRVIGFSPDGRYFAYEQYQDDEVSDAAIAAIDVIDRDTGRSAGFPFGFLGMSAEGRFPAPVGGHRIKHPRQASRRNASRHCAPRSRGKRALGSNACGLVWRGAVSRAFR